MNLSRDLLSRLLRIIIPESVPVTLLQYTSKLKYLENFFLAIFAQFLICRCVLHILSPYLGYSEGSRKHRCCLFSGSCRILTAASPSHSNDVDMEVDHFTNGVTESSSNGFLNGSAKHAGEPDNCDADMGE